MHHCSPAFRSLFNVRYGERLAAISAVVESRAARRPFFGNVDAYAATVNFFAVHFGNRRIRGAFVRHFDKAEALRLVGKAVFDNYC